MIVVIGLPAYREDAGAGEAGGLAADVAAAARAAGSAVELAGKVGDDPAGDAVVLALSRAGVGHAALLRDPARATPLLVEAEPGAGEADDAGHGAVGGEAGGEGAADTADASASLLPADPALRPTLEAGDVALSLDYLARAAVVVLAEPLPEAAVAAVVEGAAFSGAQLVVLTTAGTMPPDLPPAATVLERPDRDDGSFARLVGVYAAGLDQGRSPAQAFSQAVEASGWQAVAG